MEKLQKQLHLQKTNGSCKISKEAFGKYSKLRHATVSSSCMLESFDEHITVRTGHQFRFSENRDSRNYQNVL
jgi:hypothetical protein